MNDMKTCLRCGTDFDNPYPEAVDPEGSTEIACVGWCSKCNALAMSVLFRWRTAYVKPRGGSLTTGGTKCQ